MTQRYVYLYFSLLIFTSIQILQAQANPDIKLGNSYKEVEAKIEEDITYEFLQVIKKKDKISVYNKPGYGLNENTVVEYYFTKGFLIQTRMIQRVVNLDASMSFIVKILTPKYGEPRIVTKEGHRAYCWKMEDKYQYCFKAFSEWFNCTCFVTLHEK